MLFNNYFILLNLEFEILNKKIISYASGDMILN